MRKKTKQNQSRYTYLIITNETKIAKAFPRTTEKSPPIDSSSSFVPSHD